MENRLHIKILYCDSYGNEHINSTIERYLKKYRDRLDLSSILLEHILLSHYGFFFIILILCLEDNISLHKFLEMFHKH